MEREPYRCDGKEEVLEPVDGYMRKAIQLVNAGFPCGKRRMVWPARFADANANIRVRKL